MVIAAAPWSATLRACGRGRSGRWRHGRRCPARRSPPASAGFLGQPVMGYLTELRMQLAVDLLHRPDRTVTEVATAVGYESDASFSRVFKRHLGTSPRQVRQAR